MWSSVVLAEVTRADELESRHVGSLAVCGRGGRLIGTAGDVERAVFPRSAIKALQCLPLIESGAADHFDFDTSEIAFACASHSGTEAHLALGERLLARIGLGPTDLACGSHEPLGHEAVRDLWRKGGTATVLHNNCSGKHIGMLATARHLGERTAGYHLIEHPVQQRIRRVLADMTGVDLSHVIAGIDGCSVPNWPISLAGLSRAFAAMAVGDGPAEARHGTIERVLAACWEAPQAMAGPGRLDTQVLTRFPGSVFIKTGAEGVYCGLVRGPRAGAGIGFALKADDGAKRGAETAVGAIIARFAEGADDLAEPQMLHNAAGLAVGDTRPGDVLLELLRRIEPD